MMMIVVAMIMVLVVLVDNIDDDGGDDGNVYNGKINRSVSEWPVTSSKAELTELSGWLRHCQLHDSTMYQPAGAAEKVA